MSIEPDGKWITLVIGGIQHAGLVATDKDFPELRIVEIWSYWSSSKVDIIRYRMTTGELQFLIELANEAIAL